MNKNEFSPYIRVAMHSSLVAPFVINTRVIYDYEIILPCGGRCKMTIDGKEYICKPNDVIFLRPGIPHKFECIDNTDFIQPHIHFDIMYSLKSEKREISYKPKEKMDDYELSLISDDVLKDTAIPCVFTPTDINGFRKIFFDVIETFQSKCINYELKCKAGMLELLNIILLQFSNSSPQPANKPDTTATVIKHYIDNNYLSIITLDSLSMLFNFNKFTLMRKFKKSYKQNIITYYRNKRLEYIKYTLKSTSISISDLAEKMNFSDIYSLSRFFKSCTGHSPTHFRKEK